MSRASHCHQTPQALRPHSGPVTSTQRPNSTPSSRRRHRQPIARLRPLEEVGDAAARADERRQEQHGRARDVEVEDFLHQAHHRLQRRGQDQLRDQQEPGGGGRRCDDESDALRIASGEYYLESAAPRGLSRASLSARSISRPLLAASSLRRCPAWPLLLRRSASWPAAWDRSTSPSPRRAARSASRPTAFLRRLERLGLMAINRARSDPETVTGSAARPAIRRGRPSSGSLALNQSARFHAINLELADVTLMHTSPCTLNTDVGYQRLQRRSRAAPARRPSPRAARCAPKVAAINTCGTAIATRARILHQRDQRQLRRARSPPPATAIRSPSSTAGWTRRPAPTVTG